MKRRILFLVIIMSTSLYAQWMPFGTGVTNGGVFQFEQHGGQLYASGSFVQIDGVAANGLAVYNNAVWADVGFPLNYGTFAVRSINGQLYVTPKSNQIDSNYVWVQNGSNWSTLGHGFYYEDAIFSYCDCNLHDIVSHNNEIYVCGQFDRISNDTMNGIAKWNGVSWQALGSGLRASFSAYFNGPYPIKMLSTPIGLIAAGNFLFAGDSIVNGIARWDGSAWHPLGEGFNNPVFSLAWWQGNLYAGGSFTFSGSQEVLRLAKWNGTSWIKAQVGVNKNGPNSFCRISNLTVIGDTLMVAGDFNNVIFQNTLLQATNIVGLTSTGAIINPSQGPNANVEAVANFNNSIFIGGGFNQLGNNIADSRMAILSGSFGVAINESIQNALMIYPNPVESKLWVELPEEACKYQIYSAEGRLLAAGITTKEIDVQLLPAGFYVLEITLLENQKISGKFTKF
jgi:hypothetical protein